MTFDASALMYAVHTRAHDAVSNKFRRHSVHAFRSLPFASSLVPTFHAAKYNGSPTGAVLSAVAQLVFLDSVVIKSGFATACCSRSVFARPLPSRIERRSTGWTSSYRARAAVLELAPIGDKAFPPHRDLHSRMRKQATRNVPVGT